MNFANIINIKINAVALPIVQTHHINDNQTNFDFLKLSFILIFSSSIASSQIMNKYINIGIIREECDGSLINEFNFHGSLSE